MKIIGASLGFLKTTGYSSGAKVVSSHKKTASGCSHVPFYLPIIGHPHESYIFICGLA